MADHVAVIREAALLIRERAQAATPGPWVAFISEISQDGGGWVAETLRHGKVGTTEGNSAFMASWHPGVALLVADFLEGAAHREEEYQAAVAHTDCSEPGDCPCAIPEPGDEAALASALAHAYLWSNSGR